MTSVVMCKSCGRVVADGEPRMVNDAGDVWCGPCGDGVRASTLLFAQQLARNEMARARDREPTSPLTYAAHARCQCGAGLAHRERDPARAWTCSRVLIETGESRAVAGHDGPFPFVFYEIKSERQPSADGATTRPR